MWWPKLRRPTLFGMVIAEKRLRQRPAKGARLWDRWGVGRSKERDGATVTETGSGKPALRQALQARGPDLDLIRELPSGPAACEPHPRPHTCQHPTARCTNPEDSSCAKAGVHTCRKLWKSPLDGPGEAAIHTGHTRSAP